MMDSDTRPSEMEESQLSNPPASDSSDGSDSSNEAEQDHSEERPIEWLATTRERRSTAGNRMKSMLAQEEPDSDLELLFAEDENDQGFSEAEEDGSDVRMDSSSDEDEDDDEANADDLAGERELERQDRAKRAAQRKRKAQAAIPAKFRKKVRINAVATSDASTPEPGRAPVGMMLGSNLKKKKKKSERTSWLPSPADLPTRASSRETTRMSKEQLHQQMVEREEKRLKQLAMMQKKAARMEALKKPPMTQEDRLREAAVVEKRNSKSLNRWEVAEKQREEERRAKLVALHSRTLKGPVITFWSGIGEARRAVVEEEKKKAPKRKREKADKPPTDSQEDQALKLEPDTAAASAHVGDGSLDQVPRLDKFMAMPSSLEAPSPTGGGGGKPCGVLAAPVLAPPDPSTGPNPKSNILAPPNTSQLPPPPASLETTALRFVLNEDAAPTTSPGPSEPAAPAPSTDVATTTRNAIIFQNFDDNAIKDKSLQTQILFGRKMSRLSKPAPNPICAITNLPARYRDPKTGLAYHDAHAYREIRRLGHGEHRWSKILNAWVGSGTVAARGVPERFLDPSAPGKTVEKKENAKPAAETQQSLASDS